MLKQLSLLRERVADWDVYPFSVPAIRTLDRIEFRSRIAIFAGENGTGKSTLLEAIAIHYGLGREGGTRNFAINSTESNHSVDPLMKALRLSFNVRSGAGYFLRAESWFNAASYIDDLGPEIQASYGGKSMHERSHGESFFTLFDHKFRRNGLFLLDEPEAALSPQRQLSLLLLIRDTLRSYKDAQFIVSSHSPILMGYPDAQIFSFDDGNIHEIAYEQTAPMQIIRRFVNDREGFLHHLFSEEPGLFDH